MNQNQNIPEIILPPPEDENQNPSPAPADPISAQAEEQDASPAQAAPEKAPASAENPAHHASPRHGNRESSAGITDRTHAKEPDDEPKKKRRHVNARPERKQENEDRVHWGYELAMAGAVIGKVILRMLSWVLNIVITIGLVGMITGTIVAGVFALWIKNYVDPTIDVSNFTTDQSLTTRLYYTDYTDNPAGTPVEIEDQRLYSSENRLWVSYDQLPKNLVNAFLAIEDHRFWSHPGVDFIPTIQATFHYFVGGGTAGGSTITQQLVKNLTGDDDVTIQRKVQEIFRAMNLEKQKSKEEILEMYLNIINLGQGCYGVQAAAQKYFSKDVSQLTLTECAALAAIPKSPTKYNPYRQPENNAERRHAVLVTMYDYGMITRAEYDVANNRELVINLYEDEVTATTTNSWYTDAVIEDVIADLQKELNLSRQAASLMIYSEGLSIYTCMDPFVQNTLQSVFEDDSNFPRVQSAVKPECSMVIVNPKNGNILGLIGGRGKKTSSRGFNIATMAKRSPGSSIKPLTVYAPALDAGLITYGSVVDDTPFMFNEKTDKWNNTTYKAYPANLPAVYKGLTTINSAVERSVNTVAMKVLDMLTPEAAYKFSQKIGMTDIVESYTRVDGAVLSDVDYAPLALGALTVGVTPREMAQAYTFLANDGIYTEARTYTKVLDKNGKVLLDNEQKSTVVVSEQTASIMTKVLQNVVKNGTAKAGSLQKYVDVAGKTGTATDDYDRWFCGYTPYYLGACWFGYEEPRTIGSIATISPATYIWDVVMTKLHQPLIQNAQKTGVPLDQFELASGVVTATYCMDSGMLLCDACKADPRGSRAETGYFTQETVPVSSCSTHVLVKYDKVTGAVAALDCPEGNLTEVGLIRVENRDFPAEAPVTDAQSVYRKWSEHDDGVTKNASDPFFKTLIGEGRYVGTSGTSGRPYNSFCFEHYVYHEDIPEETAAPEKETEPPVKEPRDPEPPPAVQTEPPADVPPTEGIPPAEEPTVPEAPEEPAPAA
ncbi:MAG: PBP1A family penicillin-binding protein [Clostridia bacterium]|nr:PBP1A family penicillin-binding protein [Clostridia bacterium]